MSKKYSHAVFIGRMEPPHKQHINTIRKGLELADTVIVALGSHRAARNIKNPWTVSERIEMIRPCFTAEENASIQFVQVRDYYYNDTTWFTDLYNNIYSVIQEDNPKICVLGCRKDESSWYIEMLPERWVRELNAPRDVMNATDVRNLYFQKDLTFTKDLDGPVAQWLMDWVDTDAFKNLQEEWHYIRDYKKTWESAPYPVTFVTTDVVVVKNGHVLVVRRKFNPGKGLLALPGGFVSQNERIIDSAFRELKEETRILVPKDTLMKYIVDQRVFDHPGRSTRGRTVTHAFCVKLPDGGDLPQVRGSDDAERALWIPLADLFIREDEFYEDHLHIITYFTNKL